MKKVKQSKNQSLLIRNIAKNTILGLGIVFFVVLVIATKYSVKANASGGEVIFSSYDIDGPDTSHIPVPPRDFPSWKNKFDNFDKQYQCLLANVFYESPRYHAKMERKSIYKKKNLSRQDLEIEIGLERIRIINVTMNRVASKNYPNTICQVVWQYKQFSWTLDSNNTNANINKLARTNVDEAYNIYQIKNYVKHELMYGFDDITGGSLSYHTTWSSPYWMHAKTGTGKSLWHKYYL